MIRKFEFLFALAFAAVAAFAQERRDWILRPVNAQTFSPVRLRGFDGIIARIGLSILFGVTLDMGVRGFWLGSSLAGLVIGVIGVFYYFSGKWKTRKLLV